MKKILFICSLFMLFSCSKEFKHNPSYPIIIINIDETVNNPNQLNKEKIVSILEKIKSLQISAIVQKAIFSQFQMEDTIYVNTLKNYPRSIYSSAAVKAEGGRKDLNEDDYFQQADLMITPTYKRIHVPAKEYRNAYKGIGPENVMFRNSGKIESYYYLKSINGKSYASLPLKLASDLMGITLNKNILKSLNLSKYGSIAIPFSSSGAYKNYSYTDFLTNEINEKLFKRAIVILSHGNEEHYTTGGIKTKAEITADAINYILIKLSRSTSQAI